MVKDNDADPGKALAAAGKKHGWYALGTELRAIVASTTNETMERDVRLVEQVCSTEPRDTQGWTQLRSALGAALVSAIETLDKPSVQPDWHAEDVNRADVLAGLARAFVGAGEPDLLSRAVEHAQAVPARYPLRTAYVPALVALTPWLPKNLKQRFPPLSHWVAWCRAQLEAHTAAIPQEPADYRRPADLSCKCALCAELKRFLEDPRENVHWFRQREDRRRHLQSIIGGDKCDVTYKTVKTGSPHALVCIKNSASYVAALKTYHEDRERLATVRAIEAALP